MPVGWSKCKVTNYGGSRVTKGIKVCWTDEIEFFYGIDMQDLENIPEFTAVPAIWPQHNGGTEVEYNVNAVCETIGDDEVHLVVTYDAADHQQLIAEHGNDFYWGTNRIILIRGEGSGLCRWQILGAEEAEDITWQAFDLAANHGRERAAYLGGTRWTQFRKVILGCDGHRCVITGEDTTEALEAAHLIPAKNGENDVPTNGVTLRADLHRLFDAGKFTFGRKGRVKVAGDGEGLSKKYRRLLRNKRLPPASLARVKDTLGMEQFRNRNE